MRRTRASPGDQLGSESSPCRCWQSYKVRRRPLLRVSGRAFWVPPRKARSHGRCVVGRAADAALAAGQRQPAARFGDHPYAVRPAACARCNPRTLQPPGLPRARAAC